MSFIPNYLSQRDPQWGNEPLGFDDTVTIGTDGCILTCLTMLVNGYGLLESPTGMNRKLKGLGSGIGFLGSLIVWPGLTQAYPNINFRRIKISRYKPAPLDEMNASLEAGQPLVVEINGSPSAGLQYHWVVLYARQGDDYLMLDPWPQPPDNVPVTLLSRYGSGRPLEELISAVVWYDLIDGSAAAPDAAPPQEIVQAPEPDPSAESPDDPAYMTVLVSKSIGSVGLRLRDQPGTSSGTLAVLAAGTALSLLEPDEQVIPKIGQVNQWLNVRDEHGNVGYVAAWYVELRRSAVPLPFPAPTPAPELMTVLVSSQASSGLRLRDRPNASGTVLEVLLPGTSLTVLEPASTAEAKIGVVNQWLSVKLPGGMTGYVAAWYVTK